MITLVAWGCQGRRRLTGALGRAVVPAERLVELAVVKGKSGFTTMEADDLASGRTPLTPEEGLAVAVQHPEWRRERNC